MKRGLPTTLWLIGCAIALAITHHWLHHWELAALATCASLLSLLSLFDTPQNKPSDRVEAKPPQKTHSKRQKKKIEESRRRGLITP